MASDYEEKYTEQEWISVLQDRLAAYEDTGLMPEEVNKVCADIEAGYMKSIARTYGIDIERLKELARADRAGWLVIPPCKMGDTVWFIPDGKRACECEVLYIDYCDASIVFGSKFGLKETRQRSCSSFGKTLFLTHDEAEKALEAMKDG